MSEILKPLENSGSFDVYEAQIKALFLSVMEELYAEKITDIYSYGTPSYSQQSVLERFIKQMGLVVVRRPETSHVIMRVLYENWTALASKRGLSFLEFALEMLWTNQWRILRQWHPIAQASSYPALVSINEQPDYFLTSRIYVLMDHTIDQKELEVLSPSLGRLVPANIVPEIGIGVFPDDVEIGVACATDGYQVGYFIPDDWGELTLPFGSWILNAAIIVNRGIARYTASKTNTNDYYDSYADLDLTEAIVRALHDSDMQKWQAVIDAANELTGVTDWVWDVANNSVNYKDPDSNLSTYQFLYGINSIELGSTPAIACSISSKRTESQWVGKLRLDTSRGTFGYCVSDAYPNGWHIMQHPNPAYDPSAEQNTKSIPFDVVAQKIISNSQSSNQAISLLAEAFLETVAKSIFNTNESKQFVKLVDLIDQFELNKVRRK